jgi:hypothetical protein
MPSSTQRARFWRRPDDVDGHDFVADPVCFEAYLLRAGPGRSEARLTDSMWSRLVVRKLRSAIRGLELQVVVGNSSKD